MSMSFDGHCILEAESSYFGIKSTKVMEFNGNKRDEKEIMEEQGSVISPTVKDQHTLRIQSYQNENVVEDTKKSSFLDIIRNIPHGNKFKKLGPSPSAKFRQFAYERDELSRSVYSEQSPTEQSRVFLVRRIDWASLWLMCKEWIKDPLNIALFIWIAIVAISGAILFMVMTGMLNSAIPNKSQRDTWFEVNNQILNALFTLMCLFQHPKRFYHLVLLCRWEPNDILVLRKIYCKNSTYKPNEWMHMMVVVSLLHLNCFAQYALCGLNLGYPRSKRPPIGVALCISVAIAAPAFASVYNILSPLGRDYESETDPEAVTKIDSTAGGLTRRSKSLEKRFSFVAKEDQNLAQSGPGWIGGLFDLWDDISLAYLSIFCSCCVFGWNMERLGFGNMYVHIMTFLLFCLAPFFIFNLAAVNINDEAVREALGVSGILLCFFGLLYGGFWRIQMRKKYNLPANTFCCGHASSTDCCQWLFCCSCSLAQEVRTADYYEIVEDKLRDKQNDDGQLLTSPLPPEDGTPLFRSTPGSPFQGRSSPSIFRMEYRTTPVSFSAGQTPERQHSPAVAQGLSAKNATSPPVPSVTRREGNMSPVILP